MRPASLRAPWPSSPRKRRVPAGDLASLRDDAEVLPMGIRIQLNNAIEEIDLLCHYLHEATLMRVIRKSDAA
jgi:hypothetical protein